MEEADLQDANKGLQSDRQYASDSQRWCPSRRLDSGYIVVITSQYAL